MFPPSVAQQATAIVLHLNRSWASHRAWNQLMFLLFNFSAPCHFRTTPGSLQLGCFQFRATLASRLSGYRRIWLGNCILLSATITLSFLKFPWLSAYPFLILYLQGTRRILRRHIKWNTSKSFLTFCVKFPCPACL